MADRMWVCHCCKMIGDDAEATRHVELKGHRVDQLDQETSDAVREQWAADHIGMVAALSVFGPGIAAALPRKESDG